MRNHLRLTRPFGANPLGGFNRSAHSAGPAHWGSSSPAGPVSARWNLRIQVCLQPIPEAEADAGWLYGWPVLGASWGPLGNFSRGLRLPPGGLRGAARGLPGRVRGPPGCLPGGSGGFWGASRWGLWASWGLPGQFWGLPGGLFRGLGTSWGPPWNGLGASRSLPGGSWGPPGALLGGSWVPEKAPRGLS